MGNSMGAPCTASWAKAVCTQGAGPTAPASIRAIVAIFLFTLDPLRNLLPARRRISSMRDRQSPDIGVNFGSHKAFVAAAEANEHDLAGAQFSDAEPAQGFHVDENVLGS